MASCIAWVADHGDLRRLAPGTTVNGHIRTNQAMGGSSAAIRARLRGPA